MKKIGLIGLGVMGQNLALNIERNGFSLACFDAKNQKQIESKQKFIDKDIIVLENLKSFVESLESPKKILLMVPAGNPVDQIISDLLIYLKPGDIIIDGGNSFFKDTQRRWEKLKSKNISFIGTGISGGEKGALLGPSIMPGGEKQAWEHVKDIFQNIAAKTNTNTSCCEWLGEGGAGHFVKMVHNGIEYADMQMICESYMLMEQLLNLKKNEMHEIFSEWNKGELNSYLIQITSDIFLNNDPETGKSILDVILDTAGQKGTGKWTSQISLDLGVPAQTITAAVFARAMSFLKEERVVASQILKGPNISFHEDKEEFIDDIRQALYASKICAYAQGFQLMRFADQEYKWNLNFGKVALLWREGCIIRAQFLDKIKEAYDKEKNLPNLLLDRYFSDVLASAQTAWRKVISKSVELGLPIPAFSSALAYYDSYRAKRLPANLLQAQRDFFGAHTYERLDKPRGSFFHSKWN